MILDDIVAEKKKQIEKAKAKCPLEKLIKKSSSWDGQIRDFKAAVAQPEKINLIAEIKKASPSKGPLRKDFQPLEIARTYQTSGASCLSILTEKKFFQGDIAYLSLVRKEVNLPILRKDFIIDIYQVYESIDAGADAILLIAQILSKKQLKDFCSVCNQLNLAALAEVHNEKDLDKILNADLEIIGINNRNLQTYEEDLRISERLMKRIPKGKIVISESGIKTPQDIEYLRALGINAVLIGETFMRSQDIATKVRELMGD